jgi:hypothetical protein
MVVEAPVVYHLDRALLAVRVQPDLLLFGNIHKD